MFTADLKAVSGLSVYREFRDNEKRRFLPFMEEVCQKKFAALMNQCAFNSLYFRYDTALYSRGARCRANSSCKNCGRCAVQEMSTVSYIDHTKY